MSVLGSTSRNVLRRARVNVRSCAASSATWHAKCIGYSWLLEPLLLPSRGLDRHRSIARCVVLATLLTGPQPDRGSVLEGEGAVKASRSTNPRGLDRGDGESVGYGDYKGLPRVLRALRILASGPTSMTTAVGHISEVVKRNKTFKQRGEHAKELIPSFLTFVAAITNSAL